MIRSRPGVPQQRGRPVAPGPAAVQGGFGVCARSPRATRGTARRRPCVPLPPGAALPMPGAGRVPAGGAVAGPVTDGSRSSGQRTVVWRRWNPYPRTPLRATCTGRAWTPPTAVPRPRSRWPCSAWGTAAQASRTPGARQRGTTDRQRGTTGPPPNTSARTNRPSTEAIGTWMSPSRTGAPAATGVAPSGGNGWTGWISMPGGAGGNGRTRQPRPTTRVISPPRRIVGLAVRLVGTFRHDSLGDGGGLRRSAPVGPRP